MRILPTWQRVFCLFCLLACISGCTGGSSPEPTTSEVLGVEDTEIRIGSSLALSGHAQYLGKQTLRGALCYIKYINDSGGVHGRQIRMIAYDDAYDPPKCVANTQRLIIEDQVFALSCYVGTPTTVKILPMVQDAQIPLIGMFTGANALRSPFKRYLINVRASYYQETEAAVKHLVEDLGLRKIAVFYQYDAYGFDGLTGTELALRRYDLQPVARGTYIRGTMDIDEGLHRIMNSGAEAVVMIGTYDPCAKFIQEAVRQGFCPLFYNVSFVGAEELARRLEEQQRAMVILSQVVPMPHHAETKGEPDNPDYIDLLHKYYPQEKPNFIGQEGFFNAKVLVEGLRRAGRNLTREKFLNAIESIRNFPLADELSVSFSPDDHQGLDRVYFFRLDNGRFTLVKDWEKIGREFAGRQPQGPDAGGYQP